MPSTPNPPLPAPSSPPPSGRPRRLNANKVNEICALITNGCGLKAAARYVGCSISTIHREARRNPDFADRLRVAERKSELTALNAIRIAARKSWRAGAYLMERADAERNAMKHARRITITQLKKYNASLVRILKLELHDHILYSHLSRLFNEVLDHCVYKIAAGRDPFPIPPEITRADSWLPAPPSGLANPPAASAPDKTPAAPHPCRHIAICQNAKPPALCTHHFQQTPAFTASSRRTQAQNSTLLHRSRRFSFSAAKVADAQHQSPPRLTKRPRNRPRKTPMQNPLNHVN
jgi:hypothetical protein